VRTVCDVDGREAGLGRCLGQGGEGAVYAVPMWPRSVAKIYARRPDDQTQLKLTAMVQLATEELASFAAWPRRLLLDRKTGTVLGFLMPRVDGHPIHALYGPTNRKSAFPDASWASLMWAARNLALAVDAVHRHGHVIGDVNEGNVSVSRKMKVRLIDCDSFQVTHLGHTYPCRVGVPLFTPPELQGQRLDSVRRTCDHDRFGLAVLVFQLLFMGRHPFAGRHPDRALSVEAAIREGLFAFGQEARRQAWEPPPFSLPLEEGTPPVADLFERAFGRDAAAGGARPTAEEWAHALENLYERLVRCRADPRHVHARANGSCPWCRIENEGGPSFFFLAPGTAPDAFDVEETWRAIEAVLSPGDAPLPCPPPPEEPRKDEPETASHRMKLALRGLVTPRAGSRERESSERRAQEIEEARKWVRRLEDRWKDLCGEADFLTRRRRLEGARSALEGLKAAEEREWAALVMQFRQKHLPGHLRSIALSTAQVPGLGPAELGRLAFGGITTAADIASERLKTILDIDPELVQALVLFKVAATRDFVLDPVTGIPGKDRKALEDMQARRRRALLAGLQSGPLYLAEARRQALVWRAYLTPEIDEAHLHLAQLLAGPPYA
jgi:DNA-binding helix-hairpin-helix protein with protein kinase domain